MKNKEKYDNYDDAFDAFQEMCSRQSCGVCPYSIDENPYYCEMKWLYDEADEEPSQWQNNIMDKFTNKE